MAAPTSAHEACFEAVVDVLGNRPEVTYGQPGSKLFGHSAWKVHDRIFAMLSWAGQFVVKLPKARVDALAAGGAGRDFSSGGRPMKEWLTVSSESDGQWLQLAGDALQFVRGLK